MRKKNLIRDALRFSNTEGVFGSITQGFSETFITPYCLALKGTARQVGFLVSLPNLIASLFGVKSLDAISKAKNRKNIVVLFSLLHGLTWIPIIAIPYIFKNNMAMFLIFFIIIYATFNGFTVPAYASMMSDYVPGGSRGRYFGFRNRLFGLVAVASSFIAGFILHRIHKKNALLGFAVIFSIACAGRLASSYFLSRMYERKMRVSQDAYFSFWDFVKRIRESNFAKFVFFVGSMSFAVNLAGPFFAVYMLRDLKMDYLTYTLIVTSATLTTIIMVGVWGRYCDIVGNIRVLKTTSLFVPLIPILWIFSSNVFYLIAIQICAGFFWAGFNLSASNFIYDAVSPAKRPRCVAYFNVVNGASIYLGAMLGGFLVGVLPPIRTNSILCLFAVSAAARMLATCVFYNRIKEVRPAVKKISSIELFSSMLGVDKGPKTPYNI